MAERRMFAKSIVTSDAFLDMPMSARCLYFTLGMLADDDGFVGSPKSIMRQCGASIDDLKILLAKRYVLGFESGVIVIKHWKLNNYLRNDRHTNTTYIEELNTLTTDQKGAYTEKEKQGLLPVGIPDDNQVVDNRYTQYRIGKDSIGNNNPPIPKGISPQGETATKNKNFSKPSIDEIKAYCSESGHHINAEAFWDFYESKGWKVGKNPMKDWKASVRNWERGDRSFSKAPETTEKKPAKEFEYTPEQIAASKKEDEEDLMIWRRDHGYID